MVRIFNLSLISYLSSVLVFLIKKIIEIISKIKPDIILQFTIKPNLYGTIAARYLKIPVINNITGLVKKLYNKDLSQLINCPAGLKMQTLKVPDTVKLILSNSFHGAKLKTLHVPNDARISEDAFRYSNIRVIRY